MAKYTADSCSVKENGMSVAMAGLPGDAARLASLLNRAERMEAALKLCRNALGAHGPCRNNSCRECKRAWEAVNEVLSLEEQST